MPKFSEKIYKVGINPCVEVPRRVSDDLGTNGYIPISGRINGRQFSSTLVPVGSGRHRLYINGQMRKEFQVGVGDKIEVILELDDQPRELPTPRELTDALDSHPKAKARYESFPPSHRKEMLTYLNSLKRPETLRRNIDRLLKKLEA